MFYTQYQLYLLNFCMSIYHLQEYIENIYLYLHKNWIISREFMSNSCLDSTPAIHKSHQRIEKTRSSQNLSKLCQNCRLIRDQLEAQLFSLKDKAHQSFMQVIQVQQLHQEQLQLLKQQHQEQINMLRQEISNLEQLLEKNQQQLNIMQRNSKRHICQFEQNSFMIENIDMIDCKEEQISKLDQSSIVQLNDIIVEGKSALPNRTNGEFFNQFNKAKQELNKTLQDLRNTEKNNFKLQERILELETQVEDLWAINQQLKKEVVTYENNCKTLKNNYDTLYQESKFMSEHIRNLSSDKFKLQRKLKGLERELKDVKRKSAPKLQTMVQAGSPIRCKAIGAGVGIFGIAQDYIKNKEEQPEAFVFSSLNFDTSQTNNESIFLTKSTLLSPQESEIQMRKSMPNYKRISHIQPFKKSGNLQKKAKESEQSQQNSDENLIKQLKQQIELKSNLKKSHGPFENNKTGIFRQNINKRQDS